MDKSFMVFIAIGLGALYLVTNFIGDIQEDDDKYRNDGYNEEQKYDKYKTVDSIGQDILDLTGADANTQFEAWNKSLLKEEFLTLFPNFSAMKDFANERIRGKILQDKLINLTNDMEDKFFSGTITAEQAKRELGSIK